MMQHKNYFEGILQLRNTNDEVVKFVVNEAEKHKISIPQIKNVVNGVDIYVSKQRFLRSLGNKLQSHFGGQLTLSRRLHTKNRLTSKDVYRINVLFKLPDFKKGDVISYRGKNIKIIGIQKKVFAKEIESGKKIHLSFKDINLP